MVTAWHPDSPGSKVTVWRPWWRRKRNPHATLAEAICSRRSTIDATWRRCDLCRINGRECSRSCPYLPRPA